MKEQISSTLATSMCTKTTKWDDKKPWSESEKLKENHQKLQNHILKYTLQDLKAGI